MCQAWIALCQIEEFLAKLAAYLVSFDLRPFVVLNELPHEQFVFEFGQVLDLMELDAVHIVQLDTSN